MIIIIPTGHSNAVVRRIPWVTIIIAVVCVAVQVWASMGPSDDELADYLVEREFLEQQILHDYGLANAPGWTPPV